MILFTSKPINSSLLFWEVKQVELDKHKHNSECPAFGNTLVRVAIFWQLIVSLFKRFDSPPISDPHATKNPYVNLAACSS